MQPDAETIQRILDIEWTMFHDVNGDKTKASCQEDRLTFEGMRRAQYMAWDGKTAELYLRDLQQAKAKGRNLPMEKYIHMMRHTSPEEYEKLRKLLPAMEDRVVELADAITEKMVEQTAVLQIRYPRVSQGGRPLRSAQDGYGVTSIETYQRGELYTYSADTLEALYAHLLALEKNGLSLAKIILEKSVAYCGYATLEEAERGQ